MRNANRSARLSGLPDLFSSIASILERLNATPTQRTVATSQGPHCKMNADEDVRFYVPGRHEVDPLDPGCFTLAIDIQSAAALYSQVSFMILHRGNGDEAAGGNRPNHDHGNELNAPFTL